MEGISSALLGPAGERRREEGGGDEALERARARTTADTGAAEGSVARWGKNEPNWFICHLVTS